MYIYSYMFKLQSPSKYSPFDGTYLQDIFSPAENSFELAILCLSAFVILLFFLFHIDKHFPLMTFFIWGSKKQLLQVRSDE